MVSALPVTNSNHVSLKRTTNNLPLSVLKNSVPRYTGLGTVLNIWTSPNEGQMIHLVVRDGEIQPGMWFSAGGWAGPSTSQCSESGRVSFSIGNVVVVYSDDEKEGLSRLCLCSAPEPSLSVSLPLSSLSPFVSLSPLSLSREISDQRHGCKNSDLSKDECRPSSHR
jgi:hypothetical protein